MLMKELAEKLKSYYPAVQWNIAADEEILKIKLYHNELLELDNNTLYMCSPDTSLSGHITTANVLFISSEDTKPCRSYNNIRLTTVDPFTKVFNRVQDIVTESSRYVKGSISLLDCIIKSKELREVIETGFDILNNPIMLMDTSYKVLSYKTNETIDDPVWSDLVEHGYSSRKFVSLFKSERIIEKILKNDIPIILNTGVAETIRRILGKIMLNGSCMGYLAVLEYNHLFSDQDVQITRLICEVISSLMQNSGNHMKNTSGLMYENVIHDLLEQRIVDTKTLAGRLEACDWKPGENMLVVTVDMCKYNDISFIDYFKNKLNTILPDAKTVCYDDSLVAVIDIDQRSFAEACGVQDHLSSFADENDLLAGISLPSKNLLDLSKHQRQSQRAVELGKSFGSASRVFDYSNFAADDFISESARFIDVMDFCHQGVVDLRNYDMQKNTEYFATLYAYLLHDKNVTATANALFIHRNTVTYRIEKIESILGSSLQDSSHSFWILLTCKLLAAHASQ